MRAKGHWGYDAAFLAACRDELRVEPDACDGRSLFLAEHDGTILGYYQVIGEPPVGELCDLFVEPSVIGRGVGGRLLAHARRTAADRTFTVLTIDADPHAVDFYLHAGALRVGEVPSGSIAGRVLPRLELRL